VTGDFIDAETAARYGLVNRVAPPEQLDAAVRELAEAILRKSPVAVETGKRMFHPQLEKDLEAAYEYAGEIMACNMMAEDTGEGIDAFMAKRKPVWKGR
jgi:enoyl-CoA hydratase/carnithine racemase